MYGWNQKTSYLKKDKGEEIIEQQSKLSFCGTNKSSKIYDS